MREGEQGTPGYSSPPPHQKKNKKKTTYVSEVLTRWSEFQFRRLMADSSNGNRGQLQSQAQRRRRLIGINHKGGQIR